MLKLFKNRRSRKELDILLELSPLPDAPLFRKLGWLTELLTWVFSESPLSVTELDFSTGHPQALRVKWLLHVLQRNPNWKERLLLLFPSIARETSIFDLLVTAGLHQQSGLFSEFLERFQRRILPRPPDDQNLELLFSAAFDSEADAASILRLDLATLVGVIALFQTTGQDSFDGWKQDTFDAIAHLALQIASLGSHPSLRIRSEAHLRRTQNTFYRLQMAVLVWIADVEKSMAHRDAINRAADDSLKSIETVYAHMDETGVSVDLVYHLERTKALLIRFRNLMKLFEGSHFSPESIRALVASLVFETFHAQSLRALFDDNTALIAKKIAENSAETGEHYIAKTPRDEADHFRSAIGGGAITAVTNIFKYLILGLPGSPFFLAFVGSLNYSISFVAIQLQGFSLATKQPAMTAATLADQIQVFDDPVRQAVSDPTDSALNPMVDEMLMVLRSQTIAVVGNIVAVVPGTFLLCGIYTLITGSKFFSLAKAENTIEHFSVLGATPFYAAWTGVLLFASSLIAGWFYHWVLFRRLPQALARSPRMIQMMGYDRARKFSIYFKKNSAGFAASISLGFLLGLSPAIFSFLGLPLDVRHVTLSTGGLVTAVMSLGTHIFSTLEFWLAVGGIFSMAVLNLLVSFSLALAVALRSKKVPLKTVRQLLRVFSYRIARKPSLLFKSNRAAGSL
ncbi:site-specific recombinase [soil metagenome]